MEDLLIPLAAILSFFGSITAILIVIFRIRHKERMALIQTGQTANELFSKKSQNQESLKIGILGIGIAFGLITGEILITLTAISTTIAYVSMSFLFGGIALIIYHLKLKKEVIVPTPFADKILDELY
ncbi:DUF6249 domain-containing protein [Flexithrix dorotheae]|uniref:DUF6249 domain-containing protein n=1 Tax=Flexithrix dorotheae TaxID=70993 RepID=UPI0003727A01|nr:DUF6249 domain-containing protein [Flexithrix dorotheae]